MGKGKNKGKQNSNKNKNENTNQNPNRNQKNNNPKGNKNFQPKGSKFKELSDKPPRTCPHFVFENEAKVRQTFGDKIFQKVLSGIQLVKKEKDRIQQHHPLVNWYKPKNLFICLVCGQVVDQTHFDTHFVQNHCLALDLEDQKIYCKKCDTDYDIETGTLCAELLNINTEKVTPLTVASTSTVKSEFKLKGLFNLGNSCWMNSVLQMLCHLPEFAVGGGRLCGSFRNLRTSLLMTEQSSTKSKVSFALRPNDFVAALREKIDFLDVREQQDAYEFLIFLLDLIRNEQGGVSTNLSSCNLTDVEKCLNSPLDKLFGFIIKTDMRCQNCQNVKTIFERTAVLSLFIPFAGTGTTLDDCLQMFFGETSPDEDRDCEFCGQKAECIMKPSLMEDHLPEVLILHLSRFRMGKNGYLKNNIEVVFTEELNLMEIINVDAVYTLFGFVTHYGSIDAGHYTSIGKVGDQYYLFDDDSVTAVNKENGFQLQPYIMFYVRKHQEEGK